MVALQIRDVPDGVRDTLAARAAEKGQSLQAFLLKLVTDEADRAANAAVLASLRGRADGVRSAPGDSVGLIAEVRRERDQEVERRGRR